MFNLMAKEMGFYVTKNENKKICKYLGFFKIRLGRENLLSCEIKICKTNYRLVVGRRKKEYFERDVFPNYVGRRRRREVLIGSLAALPSGLHPKRVAISVTFISK